VRYFKGDIYMEYLVGSGILRRNQLDDQACRRPDRRGRGGG
jgi:hypothetical protein